MMMLFTELVPRLVSRLKSEEGAAMVEYGLLVSLIAVVAIAALLVLGPAIAAMFTGVAGDINAP